MSIIKRRISDYRKKTHRHKLYASVSNAQMGERDETLEEVIDRKHLEKGQINENENSRFEFSDVLENIWCLVGEYEKEFTSWELDYIGALYDAYDNDIGFETEQERLSLMGVDSKSKPEVKEFRKQVKKFIKTVKKLLIDNRV